MLPAAGRWTQEQTIEVYIFAEKPAGLTLTTPLLDIDEERRFHPPRRQGRA